MRRRRIPQVHLTAAFGEQSTFYGTADTALFIQPPPFHPLVAGADPSGAIRRAAVRPSAVDDLVSVRLFAVFCGHQCRRRRRMKLGKVHVVRVAVAAAAVAAAAQHGRFNLGYAYMCCPPSPLAPSHAIAH